MGGLGCVSRLRFPFLCFVFLGTLFKFSFQDFRGFTLFRSFEHSSFFRVPPIYVFPIFFIIPPFSEFCRFTLFKAFHPSFSCQSRCFNLFIIPFSLSSADVRFSSFFLIPFSYSSVDIRFSNLFNIPFPFSKADFGFSIVLKFIGLCSLPRRVRDKSR